mgnify:CR=1 FL=1
MRADRFRKAASVALAVALAACGTAAPGDTTVGGRRACAEEAVRGSWQEVSEQNGWDITSQTPFVTVADIDGRVVILAVHPQEDEEGERPGVWLEDCVGGVRVERSTVWRERSAYAAALTITVSGQRYYVSAVTEDGEGEALDRVLARWVESWVAADAVAAG